MTNEEIIDKILENLKQYKCVGFKSSDPKSKCANCGKHYLTHGNHLTHKDWIKLKKRIKKHNQ
jgi:hypothetical protein